MLKFSILTSIIHDMIHKSYIITGPTASGKSNFAHMLARRINGVIINCDSVQIYRGIESISASPLTGIDYNDPNQIEIDGIPYKLFSILPLSEQISVADYLEMARREYSAALATNRVPIFVGGTGYYINAIINGISSIPPVSPENRKRARDLVAQDINAARALLPINITLDPQRTARALEVLFETNRQLVDWQNEPKCGAIEPTPYRVLVNPPRDILLNRIAQRIPEMLNMGAIDEAKNIISAGFDETRAIGTAQLCQMLRAEINIDECTENWITKTNQYAKRQRTWFRTQYAADIEIPHVPTDDDINMILLNKKI